MLPFYYSGKTTWNLFLAFTAAMQLPIVVSQPIAKSLNEPLTKQNIVAMGTKDTVIVAL